MLDEVDFYRGSVGCAEALHIVGGYGYAGILPLVKTILEVEYRIGEAVQNVGGLGTATAPAAVNEHGAFRIQGLLSGFREAFGQPVNVDGAGDVPFYKFLRRANIQQLDVAVRGQLALEGLYRKILVAFAGKQPQER